MENTANKAIARSLVGGLTAGNLDVANELLSTDFIAHMSGLPEPIRGVEAFKQYVSVLAVAFPDQHYTVEDEIAEGDKVVLRWTVRGTHKGEFRGIPPTGKQIAFSGVNTYRIASGKVVEEWSDFDRLDILQQIGVIPRAFNP
ncbi:MAG: ester cyclase [Chloroflexi bacterium]|nr:MAG: ester cyclase [Chloroflexota bacterium]